MRFTNFYSAQPMCSASRAGLLTACFGKWHLGWQKKFLPLQHGFYEYVGLPYSNDMWPNSHIKTQEKYVI